MPFAIDEAALAEKKTFDRGNPPIKMIPYQSFPKMIYNHKASKRGRIITRINPNTYEETQIHVAEKIVHKVVQNQAELDEALKAGWELKPPKFGEIEPEEEGSKRK